MNDDVSVEYSFFSRDGHSDGTADLPHPLLLFAYNVLHLAVTTPEVWFIQPEDLGGVSLRGVG